MDFNNRVLGIWHLFGLDVWITETTFATWMIMAGLIILAIIVRIKLKKFQDVPTGFQNVVELMVETMENFVNDNMGEEHSYFGGYFFGLFAFILFSNFSGLIGLRPPTADLATTASFALTTFVLIHFMGITKGKTTYFKDYLAPNPVFLPLNIIGELAKPLSLSFRMFGNILGGLIIMGLVYSMFPVIFRFFIPAALHIYFDIFAGALQSFIFCILSMTFIREKIPEK